LSWSFPFSFPRVRALQISPGRPAPQANVLTPSPLGCHTFGGYAIHRTDTLELRDLKARIKRPDELARGLAKEIGLQKGAEGVLLFRERQQYLRGIQDALAGAEAARVVLRGW
jgi:hypothetical protein